MRTTATLALACGMASSVAANSNAVHPERQLLIDATNGIPNLPWKAAANQRWAGEGVGASKSLLGVDMDAYKQRLAEKVADGRMTVNSAGQGLELGSIPTAFDSATNKDWSACAEVIGDIRDQSNCGCCWAFGAASAASDRLCIATGGKVAVPLSAQDMCFCGSDDGCGGGFPEGAWETISSEGLVTGGQNAGIGPFGNSSLCSAYSLPHCHHHGPQGSDPYPAENAAGCPSVTTSPSCPRKCDASAASPHADFKQDKYSFAGTVQTFETAADIQRSIMKAGPVETAFTVYSDFENYSGGVYKQTSSDVLGGHAVRIVGWGVDAGTKYWKVANSWNPFWGESGYFRILRGSDECGIESGAVASDDATKWTGPGI